MIKILFVYLNWPWKITKKLFTYLNWLRKGSPVVTYSGFNCGCCGNWIYEKHTIPTHKSAGKWWDTWGLCDKCAKDGVVHKRS